MSAWLEAMQIAGFPKAEADKFFGRPRFAGAADVRIVPSPTGAVQRAYLARFAELAPAV